MELDTRTVLEFHSGSTPLYPQIKLDRCATSSKVTWDIYQLSHSLYYYYFLPLIPVILYYSRHVRIMWSGTREDIRAAKGP